jgi:hypothetical protein
VCFGGLGDVCFGGLADVCFGGLGERCQNGTVGFLQFYNAADLDSKVEDGNNQIEQDWRLVAKQDRLLVTGQDWSLVAN